MKLPYLPLKERFPHGSDVGLAVQRRRFLLGVRSLLAARRRCDLGRGGARAGTLIKTPAVPTLDGSRSVCSICVMRERGLN